MQVTSVGHAGFRIDTKAGSILCDPWVNPAYFASWFPFPDNSALDWDALGDCDYLYVSHLHDDHFDPKNLREHVNKDAVVLLPDFPVPDLQRELEKLGFHRFFETTDSVKHRVSGPKGELDVMIIALRAPADGPIGDSGLVVDDGETVCFNMNDARPVDLDVLRRRVRRTSTCTCCSTRAPSGTRWSTTCRPAPRKRSARRSVSARWTAAASTSRRSAPPGWSRPRARRASWIPSCATSTTTTATRPTSSRTRSSSSTRCAAHGHDRGLLMIPGSTADFTGSQLNSLTSPDAR